MAKKIKESKPTKGMVIELSDTDRANLKTIQGRHLLIGVNKTMAQIACDCLKIGIQNKLSNTEKL